MDSIYFDTISNIYTIIKKETFEVYYTCALKLTCAYIYYIYIYNIISLFNKKEKKNSDQEK